MVKNDKMRLSKFGNPQYAFALEKFLIIQIFSIPDIIRVAFGCNCLKTEHCHYKSQNY